MPIRSYLKSDAAARLLDGTRFTGFVVCRRYWRTNLKSVRKAGTKLGGEYIDGIHFTFAGGQIRSFMALISYFDAANEHLKVAHCWTAPCTPLPLPTQKQ